LHQSPLTTRTFDRFAMMFMILYGRAVLVEWLHYSTTPNCPVHVNK
jgi:hypothetical protein